MPTAMYLLRDLNDHEISFYQLKYRNNRLISVHHLAIRVIFNDECVGSCVDLLVFNTSYNNSWCSLLVKETWKMPSTCLKSPTN